MMKLVFEGITFFIRPQLGQFSTSTRTEDTTRKRRSDELALKYERRNNEAHAVAVRVDQEASEHSTSRPREHGQAFQRIPARTSVLGYVVHQDRTTQGLRAAHHATPHQEQADLQYQRLGVGHEKQTPHCERAREGDNRHAAARLGQPLRDKREDHDDERLAHEQCADVNRREAVLLLEEQREKVDRHAGAVAENKVRDE
ncbi:hypothetical protein ON010_g18962 [Phytophthora cinnamomi]|nr:hypothetical protein ON010_g18962 [Phytophthora cinnamomi]